MAATVNTTPTQVAVLYSAIAVAAALLAYNLFATSRRKAQPGTRAHDAASVKLLSQVKAPVTTSFWGHVSDVATYGFPGVLEHWCKLAAPMIRVRMLGMDSLMVQDAALASHVFGRGPGAVPSRAHIPDIDMVATVPGASGNLINSSEEHWRLVRKAIAPAFSTAQLKAYAPCIFTQAHWLADQLAQAAAVAPDGIVDVGTLPHRAVMGVVLKALLELTVSEDEQARIQVLLDTVLAEAAEQDRHVWRRMKWELAPWLPSQAATRRAMRELKSFWLAFADQKLAKPPPANATSVGACLTRLALPGGPPSFTRVQLASELGLLVFGAADTTTAALTACLYAAARYPAAQVQALQELRQAGLAGLAGVRRELSYTDITRLPYLTAFMHETLRLWTPQGVGFLRKTNAPTELGGVSLPTNTLVWVNIWTMHRSPQYWEDPLEFKPERWLQGTDASHHKGHRCFYAFSDGAKACMGQALALMELRAMMATVLCRFQLSLAPDDMFAPMEKRLHMQFRGSFKLCGLRLLLHERE